MAGLMIAVTLVTRQESRQDSYRKWILQFNCRLNIRNVSSERLAQIHADNTAVSRWTVQGFRFPFEFMLCFTNTHISFLKHSIGPTTHMWMQLTPYSPLWNLLETFSELWKQQQFIDQLIFALLISVKIRNITDILFTDQQTNSWGIADHQTSHVLPEGQP